jgi:hypothetical protein
VQKVSGLAAERSFATRRLGLCINCLTNRLATNECMRGLCRQCNKKHHTLLHFGQTKPNNKNNIESPQNPPTPVSQVLCATNSSDVASSSNHSPTMNALLVYDANGVPIYCHVILDSASESNHVTEKMAQSLRLKKRFINGAVAGMADKLSTAKAKPPSNHDLETTPTHSNS